MNTQEIQEWSEEFDEKFGTFMTACGKGKIIATEVEIKSFISQKLKEQEERHKREIEELYGALQDCNKGH